MYPFSTDKDPAPQYLDRTNRRLLKSMTRLQLNKVFGQRQVAYNRIQYEFLTTEDLKEKINDTFRRAKKVLKMPPVVAEEHRPIELVSKDPGLMDFDEGKIVITDITFGVNDRERTILVRHENGTLETADDETRSRMNQIYNPKEGRNLVVPQMFEPELLKIGLQNGNYEFILDRACVQFEPFESDYHRVTSQVYLKLNETNEFDRLRSTRHFGPMTFFLAWHRLIDGLLLDMIKRDYLRNGAELIALSYNLNDVDYDKSVVQQLEQYPENTEERLREAALQVKVLDLQDQLEKQVGKTENELKADEISLDFIQKYVEANPARTNLQLALSTRREENEQKQKLFKGLQKAHGVD